MKKIKLFIKFLVIFFGINFLYAIPVAAVNSKSIEPVNDVNNCAGETLPTQEELQWMEENLVHTAGVRLNSLGIERVNEERERQGLKKLDESTAAEFGEETIMEGDIKRLKSASQQMQRGTLLPAVDNMDDERTKKYFPPVVDQIGGSCGAYSLTYYIMTYMNAIVNDYNVKEDPSKILSPRFTYNLANEGIDDGMKVTDALSIALKHGCPSIVDFPMSGSNQHTAWPTTGAVWRNALNNKAKEIGYGYIGSSEELTPVDHNKDVDLTDIKTYLSDGYILKISTYFDSWKWKNRYGTNEEVCIAVDGDKGQHGMTVVGYDDDIWVDINGNGKKDTGELGAFRIVNSHGKDWKDNGCAWFAYDALNEVSSVSGAPVYSKRQKGWISNEFYWVNVYKSYIPLLTAEFTINTNKRDQVSIMLGQSSQSSSVPSATWTPYVFNNNGGAFSIDGTTVSSSATVVLDYTNLIKGINLSKAGTTKWYLRYKGFNASFSDMRIKDEIAGTSSCSFDGTYADKEYMYKYKELSLPCIVAAEKQWKLKFNWPMDPSTVTSQNIFVKDAKNNNVKVSIELSSDGKTVVINPPQEGYIFRKHYTMNITKGLKTQGGNSLSDSLSFEFMAK